MLIAEDDEFVRGALSRLLSSTDDMTLVGAAVDGAGAVRLAAEQRPMVAILDVRMPDGGSAAARGIREVSPSTAVIALSAYEDDDVIRAMRSLGALEFLVKGEAANRDIKAAIRRAVGRA